MPSNSHPSPNAPGDAAARLQAAATGTDEERLAALEELYHALESELEDSVGQTHPPRR